MIYLPKGGGQCQFGPYVDPPLGFLTMLKQRFKKLLHDLLLKHKSVKLFMAYYISTLFFSMLHQL